MDIWSAVDFHGLQGVSLSYHGLLHGLQGNLCSGTWSTSSLSFCADLGVCRAAPLTLCHSSLWMKLHRFGVFSAFLTTLSQRHYHRCWWAQPCPAVGPFWSQVALALSVMEEASGSFSQKPPLYPPSTKTLPHRSNTGAQNWTQRSEVWTHRCWVEGKDQLPQSVFSTLCSAGEDFCDKIQASFFDENLYGWRFINSGWNLWCMGTCMSGV